MLGLWSCVSSLMHIGTGIANLVSNAAEFPGRLYWWSNAPNLVAGLVYAAIGIFLIIQSRRVVTWMFRNEEE